LLELKNIRFRYSTSKAYALHNVNLQIETGEFVLLAGKSGCGKTTVTRIINGLIPNFFEGNLEGDVLIEGQNLRNLKIHQISDSVGSVFQDPRSQFFTRNTTSEIAFSCENAGMPRGELRKRVHMAVNDLQIKNLAEKDIFTLSSGEKQCVAIASVYAFAPNVFVLDEPSANLDENATEKLKRILTVLKEKCYTIIISEHRIHFLRDLVDKAVLMENGEIVSIFDKKEFVSLTNEKTRRLGLRCISTENLAIQRTPKKPSSGNVAMELAGVSFAYPYYENILDDIHFSVRKGEVLGVVGHNGAGKSTLIELICGLSKEQTGLFRINGERACAKERRKSTYYVAQDADYQLFTESVEEELLLGNEKNPKMHEKAEYVMRFLGLGDFRERHPFSLSGGQKQRVSIAVAYMKDADILCFDEPTCGLDVGNMYRVSRLIRSLAEKGKAIIVISHDHEFLISICGRIIRIDNGSISDDFLMEPRNITRLHQSFQKKLGGIRMEKKRKPGLKRLLEIAGEEKFLLVLSGIISTLSVLLLLVPYISVYNIMAELLRNASEIASADGDFMIKWAVYGLISMALGYILMYVGVMGSHVAAFRIMYGVRVRLSNHISKLPLGFFNLNTAGKIKTIVEQDVEKLESFIAHHLPDLVSSMVMFVVMAVAMFYFDPLLAIVCLVPIIAGYAAQFSMMMGQKAKTSMVKYFNAQEEINASAVQYLKGMPSIKIFGQTVHSFRKFYNDMVKYRDFCVEFTDNFQSGFVTFRVLMLSLATFILPVGLFVLSGKPDNVAFALTLLFFLVLAPGISTPIFKLNNLASSMKMIMEGVSRADKVLDEEPMSEPGKGKTPSSYEIHFNDVSFSYDGKNNVLQGIDFVAAQGEITALVGPSGSGKSTIAQLIPRFWDIQKGSIHIGGVDIRDIESSNLMNIMSFVFQDSFLFSDTVFNNILLGKPEAGRDEVIGAAKAAQCHEFIERLPKGYETLIGEGGVYLSGGEEQRISVARAILKNAPILVLDEATAYADPENEYQMQLALGALIKNKTVIIIAHRLTTICNANQIIVLEKGQIVDCGIHEQLLSHDGLYKRMWDVHTEAVNWRLDLPDNMEVALQ